jgi:hypothetical protein
MRYMNEIWPITDMQGGTPPTTTTQRLTYDRDYDIMLRRDAADNCLPNR